MGKLQVRFCRHIFSNRFPVSIDFENRIINNMGIECSGKCDAFKPHTYRWLTIARKWIDLTQLRG